MHFAPSGKTQKTSVCRKTALTEVFVSETDVLCSRASILRTAHTVNPQIHANALRKANRGIPIASKLQIPPQQRCWKGSNSSRGRC